jgi:hypothetical protein
MFIPTHKKWQKKRIYKKKEDDSFWYFDYYHKDQGCPHYEVFDKQGSHMYEANAETGEDISKSKDIIKSISNIL